MGKSHHAWVGAWHGAWVHGVGDVRLCGGGGKLHVGTTWICEVDLWH